MYDAGADVVYAAAGGSGIGVFQAAKAADALAIGVDTDQYESIGDASLQPVILTSMLKRVDVAVYSAMEQFVAGEDIPAVTTFDLADDGVGYSTSGGFVDDIKTQLDELTQQISTARSRSRPPRQSPSRWSREVSVPEPAARPGRRAGRHHQALPRRRRQPGRLAAPSARRGARRGRRERRRQVDADEDPLRDAARPTRARSASTAGRSGSPAPRTRSRPGSAWSTSTSCSPTTSPSSRTSSSAPSRPGAAASTGPPPARASASSASATASASTRTPSSRTSASATGSASRSSRCSTAAPGCSSSTSRPPCSCRRRSTSCSPRSPSCAPRASRSLFISHKLDEVLRVADVVTVLRAGTTVATVRAADTTPRELAELMVGRELPTPETRESTVTRRVELAVEHLTVRSPDGRAVVDDVDLHRAPRRGRRHRRRRGQRPGRARRGAARAARPPPAPCVLGGARHHRLAHRPPPRGRHRLHPRGPAPAGPAAAGAAVGEPRPRPPDAARPGAAGPWIDRKAARARHRADRARVRRAHPRRRRPRLRPVRRQPAEARRRPRDERRPPRCSSPRHPTRGVDVGAQAAIWDLLRGRPRRRAGRAARLAPTSRS